MATDAELKQQITTTIKNKTPQDQVQTSEHGALLDEFVDSKLNKADVPAAPDISGIQTNATAIANLAARVTTAETNISTNDTDITNLAARVTTTETNITTNTTNITALGVRVTANETSITAIQTAATALTTRVTTLEGQVRPFGGREIANSASGQLQDSDLSAIGQTIRANVDDDTDRDIIMPQTSDANQWKKVWIFRIANGNDSGEITIRQHASDTGSRFRTRNNGLATSITLGNGNTNTIQGVLIQQIVDTGDVNNWQVLAEYNTAEGGGGTQPATGVGNIALVRVAPTTGVTRVRFRPGGLDDTTWNIPITGNDEEYVIEVDSLNPGINEPDPFFVEFFCK